MVSRVTLLDGLLIILRPFDLKKIQSRQSEDTRRETRRLDILRLQTITQVGTAEESADDQRRLSQTSFRDQSSHSSWRRR